MRCEQPDSRKYYCFITQMSVIHTLLFYSEEEIPCIAHVRRSSLAVSLVSPAALPRRTPLDLIHLSSKPTQSAVVRIFCVSNMAPPAIHRSFRINTAKQKSKVEVADRCRWSVLQVCHFSVVRAQTILLCSWQLRQCSIHSLLLVHSILLSHSDIKN